MLKRTLAIFTLVVCGVMNLQATEAVSKPSPEIQLETTHQDKFAACCKKKRGKPRKLPFACCKKKDCSALSSTETILAGCKKCKGHSIA